jgi:hypothetical protein
MTGPTLGESGEEKINKPVNKSNSYAELVSSYVKKKLDNKDARLNFAQSIE